MFSARAIDVEQEGRMCTWGRKGGERGALNMPALWVLVGIGGCQELRGEGSIGWILSQPKSGRKSEIDFLKTAVRDMIDRFEYNRRQGGSE